MSFSNKEVARRLREVAAAYTLRGGPSTHSTDAQGRSGQGSIFQIRAYDSAATTIEQLTFEIKDLWEEGRLDQIPGIGESLRQYLDELFKTGKVRHWDDVKKGIPELVFELLDVPGVGPKTALKISKLGVKSITDLKHQLKSGGMIKRGFSAKLAKRIEQGIAEIEGRESGRMLLTYAFAQAERVLEYLKKNPKVKRADALGSLRRMVATVGDLDFAVGSEEPQEIVDYIIKMPGISRVMDQGETKVTLALSSGVQLDFLIVNPSSYGALLQHFTGSKAHNIHLRTIAEKKGLSLSEYGVKDTKTGRIHVTPTEEEFYKLLGMQVPPPEIREDTGEIEAALNHKLPKLVELNDIRGDLQTHSDFITHSSHDSGANEIGEMVQTAKKMGYEFLGIADHQPSASTYNKDQVVKLFKKRAEFIDQINYSEKNIRVLNLLEIDILPNGSFSVPDEGLRLLDFAIAGVHSAHRQPKEKMTERILKALENPYVKALSHPTGRLINERESYEVDWGEVFKFAAKNNKALEINAWPNRLDLPDILVREAKRYGVKFIICTDSHEKSQMEYMRFGVAVAKRGWAAKEDVVNTWDWTRFAEWFKI